MSLGETFIFFKSGGGGGVEGVCRCFATIPTWGSQIQTCCVVAQTGWERSGQPSSDVFAQSAAELHARQKEK